MNAVIVIPARYSSTRFPGKPLAPIAGKTLIRRVYERVSGSRSATGVWIATDDDRIADHVDSFGGRVVMTSPDHPSGTDRIAEALRRIEKQEKTSVDQIVNVQGDEPLIDVGLVDNIIERLQSTGCDAVTLACPIFNESELRERNVVKVVTDLNDNALYFSRAPIPYGDLSLARRHIGVYGYQKATLLAYAKLEPTPLERSESLEQLRLLQNGYRISVIETSQPHLGVDHPDDVERVEEAIRTMTFD